MNKIKIKVVLETWDSWELEGDLVDIIAKLQKVVDDNPDFFDFKTDAEIEDGYYNSRSMNFTIAANRWETDKEFEDRMSADKKSKEEKRLKAIRNAEAEEKRQRSLYESLKRKFEKEIEESNNS